MVANDRSPLNGADYALVVLLLVGIYLEIAIMLSPTVPVPSVIAGAAGLALIWRRRDEFTARQLAAFLCIVLVLAVACFCAPDWRHLGKRITGLIQMTYSLVIAFGLLLTLTRANRRVLARIFLTMCLVILAGAQLESFSWMREISDAARQVFYRSGIYESDLRDLIFYGKVRPKFFTSEPSAVTFSFALLSLSWFLSTESRYRLIIFALLMVGSMVVIPGPTTLIAALAAGAAYMLLPDRDGNANAARRLALALGALVAIVLVGSIGSSLYAERLDAIAAGRDPSFFYRVVGPALVAGRVLIEHGITGIGLTSEEFGGDLAMNVFVQSPSFSTSWRFTKFSEVLTNYFWLHWIYLGGLFGVLTLVAISVWLRVLGVGALIYCWLVWALFGQASGAYVGPKTWVVLALVAALAVPLRRARGAPMDNYKTIPPERALGVVPVTLAPRHRLLRTAQ
ncbi:MAG: hypothetical protein AB7F36_11655 [Reyranellaceae bacterium]